MIFSKRKRKQIDQLRALFGNVKEEDIDFEQVRKYHDRKDHAACFQVISESTSQDLDFEHLFPFLDRTTSKPGQQYLYNRLHCLTADNAELQSMERLVQQYQKDEQLRLEAQYLLTHLNDPEANYIANLFQTPSLQPPKWFFVVPLLALTNVMALLLSVFRPQYLLLVMGITVINVIIHYWNKWNLYDYLTSIPQLLSMYRVARELMQLHPEGAHATLYRAVKNMEGVRKRMFLFKLETGVQDDLKAGLSGVFELVKIVFLLDPLALFSALKQIEDKKDEIERVFDYVGRIDTAISIASLRAGLSTFCIPEIIPSQKAIRTQECVHPLVSGCVPNSLELSDASLLLTGSNMSGKTTFIRTIGINALTALTINTCFAESFSIPRLRLWSAIRISDDLMNDRSYYFEEVLTIKEMIAHSGSDTPNLFLLDELYKGTNTIERISGGKAVLSHLNKGHNIVLVSTHDVELTTLLDDEYVQSHFTEQVIEQSIAFDYQLKPGPWTTRNAIKILELNDYPKEVVAEARYLASSIAVRHPVQV